MKEIDKKRRHKTDSRSHKRLDDNKEALDHKESMALLLNDNLSKKIGDAA